MFFSSDYELQLRYLLPSSAVLKENESDEEVKTEDQIMPTAGSEEKIDDAVLRNIDNCKIAEKTPGEKRQET